MGKVIAKNIVKRMPGYLYYVDGKGNVCEAKMARVGKKKKKKVQEELILKMNTPLPKLLTPQIYPDQNLQLKKI